MVSLWFKLTRLPTQTCNLLRQTPPPGPLGPQRPRETLSGIVWEQALSLIAEPDGRWVGNLAQRQTVQVNYWMRLTTCRLSTIAARTTRQPLPETVVTGTGQEKKPIPLPVPMEPMLAQMPQG